MNKEILFNKLIKLRYIKYNKTQIYFKTFILKYCTMYYNKNYKLLVYYEYIRKNTIKPISLFRSIGQIINWFLENNYYSKFIREAERLNQQELTMLEDLKNSFKILNIRL